MKNRYQHIFLGYCCSCNNFGHKAFKCRAYGKVHEYKEEPSKSKETNHNCFGSLQIYDIECYECNSFGHMDRECKLRKNVSVVS